jgi:hypothetical protein
LTNAITITLNSTSSHEMSPARLYLFSAGTHLGLRIVSGAMFYWTLTFILSGQSCILFTSFDSVAIQELFCTLPILHYLFFFTNSLTIIMFVEVLILRIKAVLFADWIIATVHIILTVIINMLLIIMIL